jgi:thioredoxin-dependent peroxiredoxin
MSKKTRKKSSKPSSGKTTRAPTKTSAKMPPSKTRSAAAKKSTRNATKKPGKTPFGTSHKAASKPLKSPGPAKSTLRTATESTSAAARPGAAKSAAMKPLGADAAAPAALIEGAKAPAFRLPRDGGETVALSDYAGKKLVLFFYPRADTPGCTREAIDFSRLADAFAESGTAVLGVSADPPKAQEAFRNKHELTTPLASDETHAMLEAYGVWGEKSMYGRIFQGIIRTTVLVGADGRVIRIWRHVRVDGHADDVLAAVRAL